MLNFWLLIQFIYAVTMINAQVNIENIALLNAQQNKLFFHILEKILGSGDPVPLYGR